MPGFANCRIMFSNCMQRRSSMLCVSELWITPERILAPTTEISRELHNSSQRIEVDSTGPILGLEQGLRFLGLCWAYAYGGHWWRAIGSLDVLRWHDTWRDLSMRQKSITTDATAFPILHSLRSKRKRESVTVTNLRLGLDLSPCSQRKGSGHISSHLVHLMLPLDQMASYQITYVQSACLGEG